MLPGFNTTVLQGLPRSINLLVVESVLMAVAFLSMLMVRMGGWVGPSLSTLMAQTRGWASLGKEWYHSLLYRILPHSAVG